MRLFDGSRIKNPGPEHDHLKGDALAAFTRGQGTYAKYCFSCHGNEGEGMKDMGPPLAGSDWATGDPEVVAKLILKGMQGEIRVSGKIYKPQVPMNAFDELMTDKEIADVMTYIRNGWGNRAPVVAPDFVTGIRKKVEDVEGPYTPGDLR